MQSMSLQWASLTGSMTKKCGECMHEIQHAAPWLAGKPDKQCMNALSTEPCPPGLLQKLQAVRASTKQAFQATLKQKPD